MANNSYDNQTNSLFFRKVTKVQLNEYNGYKRSTRVTCLDDDDTREFVAVSTLEEVLVVVEGRCISFR